MSHRSLVKIDPDSPLTEAALHLEPVTLVAEERTIKGSHIRTAVPSRDIPRYIQLYTTVEPWEELAELWRETYLDHAGRGQSI